MEAGVIEHAGKHKVRLGEVGFQFDRCLELLHSLRRVTRLEQRQCVGGAERAISGTQVDSLPLFAYGNYRVAPLQRQVA